jgi:diadenosine tetraphosphate (Ap4A) HIT family hydrolase
VGSIARGAGLVEPGYRLLVNVGANGGQEVPHFHIHIFGGKPLGAMITR